MSRRGPLTPEEREWAAKHGRGAGAAAVLMFLHVVLVGYLLCILWFLIAMLLGRDMAPSMQWIWQVLLPAWVAVLTYIPTDKLTRGVGKTAIAAGVAVLLTSTIAWFTSIASGPGTPGKAFGFFYYFAAFGAAMVAAAVLRLAFRALIKPSEVRKLLKDEAENGKSE
jgi:hypothetical protein